VENFGWSRLRETVGGGDLEMMRYLMRFTVLAIPLAAGGAVFLVR
jgi:hypothetical protein